MKLLDRYQQQNKNDTPTVSTISLIKRIYVLQKRVILLMSSSAVERYHHFVETYPDIVKRVPQRMVASYIGVTLEKLNRNATKLVDSFHFLQLTVVPKITLPPIDCVPNLASAVGGPFQ